MDSNFNSKLSANHIPYEEILIDDKKSNMYDLYSIAGNLLLISFCSSILSNIMIAGFEILIRQMFN